MIHFKSKVAGYYGKFLAVRPDGSVRILSEGFQNLVTDNGLDLMNSGGFLTELSVGTGTTAPTVSDTALDSLVASTTNAIDRTLDRETVTSPFYTRQVVTFEFGVGAAAGNLAEVGVGLSPTDLFSRSLIKDAMGNPTTITVLADEILRVEYEARVYIPETDQAGTVDIDAVTYNWTARASEITDSGVWRILSAGAPFFISSASSAGTLQSSKVFDGTIGAITGGPSGSGVTRSSISIGSYTTGDYFASAELTWGVDRANFAGGIQALTFSGESGSVLYQIGFSPAIPKTDQDIFTMDIRHSWARV